MHRSRALAVIEVILLAAGLAQMLFSELVVTAMGALLSLIHISEPTRH